MTTTNFRLAARFFKRKKIAAAQTNNTPDRERNKLVGSAIARKAIEKYYNMCFDRAEICITDGGKSSG